MVSKHRYFPKSSISILVLSACAMFAACGPAAIGSIQPSAMASGATTPPPQLINQLQTAKSLDESGINDRTITQTRRGDFLEHEAEADRLIHDLQHGVPATPEDLKYALEVPPRHLQLEEKTQLIVQLKDAIHKDEQREQGVVAFGSNIFYEDADAPSQFGAQQELAQKEIQSLEVGNAVSWDELQSALYVPPNPL
jgi:hypothetical protein